MRFDDEQIADEKSIQNMKMHYLGANKNLKVQALGEERKTFFGEFVPLGKNIKKANKLLGFLKDCTHGEFQVFVDELIKVNELELQKLANEYGEMEKLKEENPELVLRPNSLVELNLKMAENEIEIIKKLISLYSLETKEEAKSFLKTMIERRLDAFEKIFL